VDDADHAGLSYALPLLAATSESTSFAPLLKEGRGLEQLITSSQTDFAPQYSPDGGRIPFCSNCLGEAFEILVTRADGSEPVQLKNGPGLIQGTPFWSPDGKWILFSWTVDTGSDLMIVENF
jgi:Tol biopolymer transport system component